MMAAIANLIIFFAVLVVMYLAATTVLAAWTWLRKRRAMQAEDGQKRLESIDESTDTIKDRLFIITIVLAFFLIAPFMVLLLIL